MNPDSGLVHWVEACFVELIDEGYDPSRDIWWVVIHSFVSATACWRTWYHNMFCFGIVRDSDFSRFSIISKEVVVCEKQLNDHCDCSIRLLQTLSQNHMSNPQDSVWNSSSRPYRLSIFTIEEKVIRCLFLDIASSALRIWYNTPMQ